MSVFAQLASGIAWALLGQPLDTARYLINLVRQSAEERLRSYLKEKAPMRKYGFVCLLIGLSTPFWHISSYEWNGVLIRRNENGWEFAPLSSYNTGLTVFVLIYESLGFLLAAAPSCVTPVLQHVLHRLPKGRTVLICPIFDGPFVLAGCIVGWFQPVEGASVSISLLLAFVAGIFFIPSGILALMDYNKEKNERLTRTEEQRN